MINPSFTQSKIWEKLLDAQNQEFWTEEIYIKNKKTLHALIIIEKLSTKHAFAYIPHGPTLFTNDKDLIKKSIEALIKKIKAKKTSKKIINIKIEPNLTTDHPLSHTLQSVGTPSQKNYQPQETVLLDITQDPEELLKSFHKKTRYNIRLAKRKGVTVRQSTDKSDIDIFNKLNHVTHQRNDFSINTENYYKTQFEIFTKHNAAKLFIAEFENQPIAANIVIFHEKVATYLHGASSNQHRNVMAPHLLQWEQILEAQKQNYTTYDFWGATSSPDPHHTWHGVTRFKKGFNPEITTYIPAYDIILNKPLYTIYESAKKIRRFVKKTLS